MTALTISSIHPVQRDETVSIAIPSDFHRPFIEPYMKFSLIRLSENSPLANFTSFTSMVIAKSSEYYFLCYYPRHSESPKDSFGESLWDMALPQRYCLRGAHLPAILLGGSPYLTTAMVRIICSTYKPLELRMRILCSAVFSGRHISCSLLIQHCSIFLQFFLRDQICQNCSRCHLLFPYLPLRIG